jgi:D-3-phosphoglycerate dehydrogenase / 2-oxoglutarate reductase
MAPSPLQILIADEMFPSLMPMLEQLGFRVDYQPAITRAQMLEGIGNYHGLIIQDRTGP